MKVYSLGGASAVHDGDEVYAVAADGSVEVPEPLGVRLRDTHIGGVKVWEDEIERHARLVTEEEERRRDPAALLAAVEALAARVGDRQEPPLPPVPPAPSKEPTAAEVRAWAAAQTPPVEVSASGKIPQAVMDAYNAAH